MCVRACVCLFEKQTDRQTDRQGGAFPVFVQTVNNHVQFTIMSFLKICDHQYTSHSEHIFGNDNDGPVVVHGRKLRTAKSDP